MTVVELVLVIKTVTFLGVLEGDMLKNQSYQSR